MISTQKLFRNERRADVERYVRYRASGGNRQSGRSYYQQIEAIRRFDGSAYFPNLPGARNEFVAGECDNVFGDDHRQILASLVPGAKHRTLPGARHMLNLERPEEFRL